MAPKEDALMMRSLTTASVLAAALALPAAPAKPPPGFTVPPPAGLQTSFAVPARLVPAGINQSVPRQDWDVCDQGIMDFSDTASGDTTSGFHIYSGPFNTPTNTVPGWAPFVNTWPAYLVCTVDGPAIARVGQHVAYRLVATNVSPQPVYFGVPGNYQNQYKEWAKATWTEIPAGQSRTFTIAGTPYIPPAPRRFPKWPRWGVGMLTGLSVPGNPDATTYQWPQLILVRPTWGPVFGKQDYYAGYADPNYTEWLQPYYIGDTFIGPAPAPRGPCDEGLFDTSSAVVGYSNEVVGLATAQGGGYWAAGNWGLVAACGAPSYQGYDGLVSTWYNLPNGALQAIASPPQGNGYWVLGQSGEVVAYGQARWHGQYTPTPEQGDIGFQGAPTTTATEEAAAAPFFTAIASTPNGHGYWTVTANGHVYAYDAPYYGGTNVGGVTARQSPIGGEYLATPTAVVGIAPTMGGAGYVLVTGNGRVISRGRTDSCGNLSPGMSVAGVAPDYRTGGYWVAATDGRVLACHAPTFAYKAVAGTVAGIAALPDGLGYRLVTTQGRVYDYGEATWHGDPN